jgi:hypothetical protein
VPPGGTVFDESGMSGPEGPPRRGDGR